MLSLAAVSSILHILTIVWEGTFHSLYDGADLPERV